ncbi:MAG: glycoside hydrolase family 3 C-terminal domain-containing protein [Alistipes sp.]|nr:glycoside hydrolase family 3 C-terminal domain-containing protein [Alistipes sp.]
MKPYSTQSVAIALLCCISVNASAQRKWSECDKGDFTEVRQTDGRTLGYGNDSGLRLLEIDGYLFKDLNRNGRLDPYEDWRLTSDERAADLASQLSVEEIAGLMLYSSHQQIPQVKKGTWGGKSYAEAHVAPSELTDRQKSFIIDDNLRHILITKVRSPYIAAQWNNNVQSLCESIGHGIPANNSSDPRHGLISDDEYNIGSGGQISVWPGLLGMAATFDPAVARRFGEVAAVEYRALGLTTALSPQIDLATDPRWRRAMATFGEGPLLATDMARAYTDGFQTSAGDDALEGAWGMRSVNAMVKHWPGGGTGESGRDAHFSFGKYAVYPGNNFEEHLKPFTEGAFKLEGGTGMASAVMPYYTISYGQDPSGRNIANGFSDYIIRDLLRTKYGYDGVVCTDWGIVKPYTVIDRNNGKPWGVEHLSEAELHYMVIMAGADQFGGIDTGKYIVEAYRLAEERLGKEAARARFEQSAVRLLRNIFRTGLFENPYIEPHCSMATVGNVGFMKEGFDAQVKSVVMVKNHGNVLPLKGRLKVYVPKRKFGNTVNYWTGKAANDAREGYSVSLGMVGGYFDVVETPEEADCAIVFIDAPATGRGYSAEDVAAGGNGYIPISLQYGDYKAVDARARSIAGGDPLERFDNRSYKGKTATTYNKTDMYTVLETRKAMGRKPVIVAVAMQRPMVFGEIERAADAVLCGFEVQNQAFMEIIAGRAEPQGLLPMQMPADMKAVEKQCEDLPFDMKCYRDADGNVYDYAYGLDWSGVIDDWRVAKYGRGRR